MPKWSRRRTQSAGIIRKRWSIDKIVTFDSNDEEDEFETKSSKKGSNNYEEHVDWNSKNMLSHIGDIFQICQDNGSLRILSTLLYMTLKYFNISWKDIDNFMSLIGGMRCVTTQKWVECVIAGDFETFIRDGRGGKQGDSFFDIYPELETAAKSFAYEGCSRKAADFTVSELADFIDSQYYEIMNTRKIDNKLIRSIPMCRLDLRRWGCKFEANTQRPYFEGHDRIDVLAYREKFLDYFLSKKNNYYLVSGDDQPTWCTPTQEPRILICAF